MAATAAFPSLSVPAPEDTMEMSSPAHHPDDNDIDLDYADDYDGAVQLEEDEQMVVDGEQSWPPTANDASMEDDAQDVLQEAQMQDQSIPEDDELIDYDDDFLDQPLIEDTVVEDVALQPPSDEAVDLTIESATSKQDDAALKEEASHLSETQEPATETVEVPQTTVSDEAIPHDAQVADESVSHWEQPDVQPVESAEEASTEGITEVIQQAMNGDTFPASITVDTSVAAAVDAVATPTDTGLHPVTLYYDDLELPLFKSKNQQDGLLKDDNLASLSLAELLSNCRHRLAIKLGRHVPEEQDFVLSFDHLGLILVEVSRDLQFRRDHVADWVCRIPVARFNPASTTFLKFTCYYIKTTACTTCRRCHSHLHSSSSSPATLPCLNSVHKAVKEFHGYRFNRNPTRMTRSISTMTMTSPERRTTRQWKTKHTTGTRPTQMVRLSKITVMTRMTTSKVHMTKARRW